jgi:hypothetical protein
VAKARTYNRDARGRFASGGGGGGGGGRPKTRAVAKGANRLTRDNAGKITSVGGTGATARGGRLRTASGKQRGTQVARVKGGAMAGATKGKVKRDPQVSRKVAARKGSHQTLVAPAKYKFTPSRLSEALSEWGDSKAMRAIATNSSPFPKGSKRRQQTVQTTRAAIQFREALDAEASKFFREAGKDWGKARVKAFSLRPTYTTRQRVRRHFRSRANPWTGKVGGWQ